MKRNRSARRTPATIDVAVSHPRDGRMRLVSRYFFADPTANVCQQFIGRIFEVEEVRAVEILASRAVAHIDYTNGVVPSRQVIQKISRHLRHGANGVSPPYVDSLRRLPIAFADAADGWRVERHGGVLSTWEIKHELPGRIRFRNRLIRQKKELCRGIDRALRRALGVDTSATSPWTGTTLIVYDPDKIPRHQLIQILDQALVDAERGDRAGQPDPAPSPIDHQLPVAGARAVTTAERSYTATERAWSSHDSWVMGLSTGVAAIGSVLYPPLGLLGVPGPLYVTRALYINGFRSLVNERRVSVDTLTAAMHVASLMAGYFFIFCLNSFMFMCVRNLLGRVKDDSRADYTDIFRQQARTVWMRVDGVEIEAPLEAVKADDVVSIAAGQTIPVDGRVVEGAATIDQHLLTGEAAPVDRGAGAAVFALTVVLSGKIAVRVEKTGAATAAAHIARVLTNTVDFKTGRQLQAERLADRLVGPALVSGLVAWPWLGLNAAVGLVDAHPKYKTTMSSSLGLLNYFKLAAREGLLIKDGRTLELLNEVDTVVFDKTGTLTLGQPHVARLYTRLAYSANDILRLAAAAEQHQSHPIARAIRHAAGARGLSVPSIEEAEYRLGYGLSVMIDRRLVRVGSMRFLDMEAMTIPPALVEIAAQCHRQGRSLVLVAVDGDVAGAIELHPSIRPEAKRVIEGLRQRRVTSMYIISGDHEAPTRRLAEALGIEHYFAETLPGHKATLIERLRDAGKVVCYVGDGINDAIAMKKAHVSVSLRGASTLATDTAEVILLDESLNQLCRLFDIAAECKKHMRMTMATVCAPSLVCVGGVLLFGFGFAHARLLNAVSMLIGPSAAMLPLLTHRAALPQTDGPEISVHVPLEESVIP